MSHKYVVIGGGPLGLWSGYLLAKKGCKPLVIAGKNKTTTGLDSGHQYHYSGCIPPQSTKILNWKKLPFLSFSKHPVSLPFTALKPTNFYKLISWYIRYSKLSFSRQRTAQANSILADLGKQSLKLLTTFNQNEEEIFEPSIRYALSHGQTGFKRSLKETQELHSLLGIEYEVIDRITAEQRIGTPLKSIIKHVIAHYSEGRIVANWQTILADAITKHGGQVLFETEVISSKSNSNNNITKLFCKQKHTPITVNVEGKPIVATGSSSYHIAKNILHDMVNHQGSQHSYDILPTSGVSTKFSLFEGSIASNAIIMWQDHFVHITPFIPSGSHSGDTNLITSGAVIGQHEKYYSKQVRYRDFILNSCFASPHHVIHEKACYGRPMYWGGAPLINETKKAIYATGLGYAGMTISPATAKLTIQKLLSNGNEK